ncbi:MAG: 50S ribosomal protein L4 [Myxococcota bacterium]
MAKLDVLDQQGQSIDALQLQDGVFGVAVRPHVLTEVVQWHRARRRRGTHQNLSKGLVHATTRKPFKQKGRGSARQGDWKSPHHRGGGVAFAKSPRDYEQHMPRAKRRLALAVALSARVREGRMKIVKSLELAQPKTRLACELLSGLGLQSALLIDVGNPNLKLGVRNLQKTHWVDSAVVNAYDVLSHSMVVMSEAAAVQLQQRLLSEELT